MFLLLLVILCVCRLQPPPERTPTVKMFLESFNQIAPRGVATCPAGGWWCLFVKSTKGEWNTRHDFKDNCSLSK
ncbi:hypothetical protein JTE90_013227 [Oedothorax gibbosus]|uniref:Secreted protein n=1 Tax=Oedothorax gibbosus TaxID=931172 RepID=A0AAV6VEM2_9ARAC|nr:hypothetical protein JTE90_013227 [Oedothorax gibbosus]